MQPHSMAMVSLVGWIWNSSNLIRVSKMEVRVEYRHRLDASYAWHMYDVSNVIESSDRREISARILSTNSGLSCVMHARRSSLQEGAEVTMTHDTIHVSGLREVFNLYKLNVSNGMSYNSMVYKAFSGSFQTDDYKRMNLTADVRLKSGDYVPMNYQVERTGQVIA